MTPDHVESEAPWPHLEELRETTEERGFILLQRLAVYPRCPRPRRHASVGSNPLLHGRVLDAPMRKGTRRRAKRPDGSRVPTSTRHREAASRFEAALRGWRVPGRVARPSIGELLARATAGEELNEEQIATLFSVR